MTEVTIRQFVWTLLSLFTLSFWINLSILIEWSTLVENNDAENLNRCNQQKNLCRYRYPIIRGPRDYSITAGPDWNTTAVGDDADSSVSCSCYFFGNIKWLLLSPHRFGRCRCDVECGRYGDCCADATDVYDIESRSSLTSHWTCLPMTTERDRYRSDQNVSFCYVPFTSTTAHLFRSYLFTLASFFFGGGEGTGRFHSSFPFRFSYSGPYKQTFVGAFCVNVREESRLPTISDSVSE